MQARVSNISGTGFPYFVLDNDRILNDNRKW